MLAEAAQITAAHSAKYAGRVKLNPADSNPHGGEGGRSDYVEHAHLVSAPTAVDDELNGQLDALLRRYRKANKL